MKADEGVDEEVYTTQSNEASSDRDNIATATLNVVWHTYSDNNSFT